MARHRARSAGGCRRRWRSRRPAARGAGRRGPRALRRRDRRRRLHRPVDGLVADRAPARCPDCRPRAGHLRRRVQAVATAASSTAGGTSCPTCWSASGRTMRSAWRTWWTRRSAPSASGAAPTTSTPGTGTAAICGSALPLRRTASGDRRFEACAGLGVADQYVELSAGRDPGALRLAGDARWGADAERGDGPARPAGARPAPRAGGSWRDDPGRDAGDASAPGSAGPARDGSRARWPPSRWCWP